MTNIIASDLFSIVKAFKGGGRVLVMRGVDKEKPDYKAILTIAILFAKEGHQVKILTSCHYKSEEYRFVYGRLIGTKYERKCPDLLVDDVFYEYEGFIKPWNKRQISNMLSHGLEQADRVIIDNNKGASDRFIRRAIMARLQLKNMCIREVWLYEKGKKRLFYEGVIIKNNGEK